jgi:hypothetical protein
VVTAAKILAVNTAVGFAVGLVAALVLRGGQPSEDGPST